MTLWALLALVAQEPRAEALMSRADARLSVPCGAECAPPAPDQRYRLGDTDEGTRAAPRSVDDTGARCSVVGARVCTGRPRKLFSTSLPQ